MTFTNYGLGKLGSFIKGDSPSPPAYMEFGTSANPITGSAYLGSGILRKTVTWGWNGNNIRGTSQLLTTDAVGSNIQEVGLGVAASVGSDLYTRDFSAIGDKNNTYSVDISWEIRFNNA